MAMQFATSFQPEGCGLLRQQPERDEMLAHVRAVEQLRAAHCQEVSDCLDVIEPNRRAAFHVLDPWEHEEARPRLVTRCSA